MVERLPTRLTPVPDQEQTQQGSFGAPAPKPEDAKLHPEITETHRTGRRYRKSREEAKERARWYMQNRRDYVKNPPTEEEIKHAQERMERARRMEEFLKNPPTERSGQETHGK